MLRIRTEARHGLRWGVFGIATAAVLTISGSPTNAAPYADIVVDANSGNVLHATNPDSKRHPASLTKIMTLYLLFEQLEAGKLKLDSQLKISAEAASQDPTKLGLKPGSTLQVEDAIKGIITRSANDAAVVVAEAIAGDEDEFAKLMTRKARALGMSNTLYKNASGLPDGDQVTTARDQATLGRAIQERFPKYYKYFSIRSFTFRGESIGNHNRLLGRVDGVDGIKTGYISASGFNLVTSVHRGNRYLVAVVMGGSSAGSRDAKMRELISSKITLASTKRSAPMVAEADAPEIGSEPKAVAKVEPKPESKPEPKIAAKPEPKAQSKPEPKLAVGSTTSTPARLTSPQAADVADRIASGSTDPIRPVMVRTVTVSVKSTGTQTTSLVPVQTAPSPATTPQTFAAAASPPPPAKIEAKIEPRIEPRVEPRVEAKVERKPEPKPEPLPEPKVEAKIEPKVEAKADVKPEPKPAPKSLAPKSEERFGLASTTSVPVRVAPPLPAPAPTPAPLAEAARPEPSAALGFAPPTTPRPGVLGTLPVRSTAMEPPPAPASAAAPAAPPAKPQARSGWMIQVGAFAAEQEAKQRLSTVQSKASKMLDGADPFTETVDKGGTTLYRARFAGLDKDKAEAACKYLKRNDVDCVTIKN